MKKLSNPVATGWKCRHSDCENRYQDVIGGDNAFGKNKSGAECLPCMYAAQMVEHGQTIEEIESVPHLMKMFTELLRRGAGDCRYAEGKTGWTWEHVKASHARMTGSPLARSRGGKP